MAGNQAAQDHQDARYLPSNDAASKHIWLALGNITAEQATATPGFQAAIDLQSHTLTPTSGAAPGFHLAAARKHRLFNGRVDRSLSLQITSKAAHVAPTQTSQPPQFPGRFTGEKTGHVRRCERGMTCVKGGGATGCCLTVLQSL